MVKVSFNFTDYQYNELTAIARRDGKPMSEVARHALDEWLQAIDAGSTKMSDPIRRGVTVVVEYHDKNDERHIDKIDFADAEPQENSDRYGSISTLRILRNDTIIAMFDMRHVRWWYQW